MSVSGPEIVTLAKEAIERCVRRVSGVWLAVCISQLYQLFRSVGFLIIHLCMRRLCVSALHFNEALRNYYMKPVAIIHSVLLKSEEYPIH